jgi:heptosyltransferase-2
VARAPRDHAIFKDVITPNVLLVRFSSLGDVLLMTPLIRALRTRHPAATLSVLTRQTWAPLLAANPHLDQVIAVGPGQGLVPLARAIRGARYSHLLDLHGSVRTRVLRLLVPGPWAGYNHRRRERAELIHRHLDRYQDNVPVAERYFDAAGDLGVTPDGQPADLFVSPAAEARAEQWLSRVAFDPSRPLVALAPGAAHATKRWPVRHWRALAQALRRAGVHFVVVGNSCDRMLGTEIAEAGDCPDAVAAGELDLQAVGALLRRCRACVAGDTGPMHMATAVRTPVVALFGPTVEQFGFFPYRAEATVLQLAITCRPCSTKGSAKCPEGHHRCLEGISPADVASKVMALVA